jgi:PqqD family protein of HPr-rel-A system
MAAPEALACREWDDESVVYDDRSGATHRLGAGATLLLQALRRSGAMTTEALLRVAFAASDPGDDVRAIVEETIAELERLGLICSTTI